MEAENRQAKEIIQPLLDTENGFVKVSCWTLCHLLVSRLTFVSVTPMLVQMCLHGGVGEVSEPTGCGRAEEEGTAAQALD